MSQIVDATEATFDAEVLDHALPAIVDFWGDNCAACVQISSILERLSEAYAGRVRVVKVHATDNPGLGARYGVRAMPTVYAISRGLVVAQLVGARPEAAFTEMAEKLLAES